MGKASEIKNEREWMVILPFLETIYTFITNLPFITIKTLCLFKLDRGVVETPWSWTSTCSKYSRRHSLQPPDCLNVFTFWLELVICAVGPRHARAFNLIFGYHWGGKKRFGFSSPSLFPISPPMELIPPCQMAEPCESAQITRASRVFAFGQRGAARQK